MATESFFLNLRKTIKQTGVVEWDEKDIARIPIKQAIKARHSFLTKEVFHTEKETITVLYLFGLLPIFRGVFFKISE